jgi:ABC-type multidrug transport system fused ATPase/permease subunit
VTRTTPRETESAPKTLYGYIWRISRRRQIWLALLSSVVFPLAMVPLELQRRMVNHAIGNLDLRLLWLLSAAYVGVVLVQGGLKYVMNVYREVISERAIRSMRRHIYSGIHDTGPALRADTREDTPTGGPNVSMVVAEVEPLGGFVGESISVPLVQIGALASVLGYMLWVEPRIATAGFVLYLPQLYVVPRIQGAINRRVEKRIMLLRELGQQLVEEADPSHTTEVDAKRYDQRIDDIYRQRKRVAHLRSSVTLLNNLLEHTGTIGVLLIGGWLAIHGRTDVGTIVAFVSGVGRISDPWRELVAFYRRASDARVRYRLVRESLNLLKVT